MPRPKLPFGDPLPTAFYAETADVVAPRLIGAVLVRRLGRKLLAARIVETEAYLPTEDPACHGARGLKRSNAALFGPPGRAYVYPIHAKWCLNTVVDQPGVGTGVLIRAAEPLYGEAVMAERSLDLPRRDWLRGPSRLCRAFDVDRAFDQAELAPKSGLWIAAPAEPLPEEARVAVSPRIGVTQATELPLRYFLRGSLFVSGLRRWHAEPLGELEPWWSRERLAPGTRKLRQD